MAPVTDWPTVVALSGDPRIGSTTARRARRAAAELARSIAANPTVVEIDLANVSASVEDLRRVLTQAEAIVVATPVEDDWPTALLLDFLDGIPVCALGGVPATTIALGDNTELADRRLRERLNELGADTSTLSGSDAVAAA
ncbi:MAG: NAD(P)H-dependent oxidoreductase [Solirubrobacteraceae bacterium]|nr:NAD(P)H-dependent oxidoreductase [Solirubrobacteraceae bacterium]